MNILDKIKSIWAIGRQSKMMAIGFDRARSIEDPQVFISKQVKQPTPNDSEILVKVLATSVNPVDTKMRAGYTNEGQFRILGFDAVGEVVKVGTAVSRFNVGDRVYYAGSQMKQGSNAAFQVVEADLVGHAPHHLSIAEIGAMPLTSITAFEILHDAFGYDLEKDSVSNRFILIINGAGGVGSILIQLAKYIGLTVITTASRPESVAWVKSLGADFILDYHQDLAEQLKHIQYPKVDHVAILQSTDAYWSTVTQIIKPFGTIASIVETTAPIDMGPLKNIGAQFSWVFMFAKGNYHVDMLSQGLALEKIAALLDNGELKPTLTTTYHGFTVENIRTATRTVEEGRTIGKVVVVYDDEK